MYWRYDADREQYHIDYWTGERYVVNYWVIGDFDPKDSDTPLELVSAQELLVALR